MNGAEWLALLFCTATEAMLECPLLTEEEWLAKAQIVFRECQRDIAVNPDLTR